MTGPPAARRKFTMLLTALLAAATAVALTVGFFMMPSRTSPESREQPPLSLPLTEPKIVVEKGQRRLTLYSAGQPVRTYRIGLGFSPVGHKQREGDGRTPEGEYYACNKNPNSRFFLSLGLSYPNIQDARQGLRVGAIIQAEYDAIAAAIRRKAVGPWNTTLGGEIFIHGHGSSSDWTRGCIALDDRDIEELYKAVPVGTPVIVHP